ncbi:DUF2931 family protein [Pseudomonas sp. NPDC007930]|uniref:DUF2931 family protein n=1 Tax=Pseudomonas sp. NPDC007930 TaxID=3364417 RepID=UPI0036E73810
MALGKALRAFVALLGCLLLSSCAKGPGGLPYDAWRLGMFVPDYMDVWVETVGVIDIQGRGFPHVLSGVPSSIHPDSTEGDPRGWPSRVGWAKGKHVRGAALPAAIIVRWQSLAEPQTYEALIPIPETARQQMKVRERNACTSTGTGKPIDGYRKAITIGLAPGGIAKAWIVGVCVPALEFARVQGQVVTLGPDQGRSGGQYALPLMPNSKAYIEKNGIPYGSW